ncbi:hypothetical protein [Acidiferrobacter sp. SPIII_3]|uniref:hypothetical protein n=1 Tax=Acidiferrobacter sp. SPIII_3 TaxID=1281578 RepID=UPI0011AB4ADB|nr:hypothetical protein [Acidiferrobacter sp. SPIII_3]
MQIGVTSDEAVTNRCVFVIHGCEISRAALQLILQDEYETHEWSTIDQALARLRERRPDLLIIGAGELGATEAGVMDGIRKASPGTRILVVVDAAAGAEPGGWQAAGTHGLLSQPLTVETVRRKVRLALGLRAVLAIGVEAG